MDFVNRQRELLSLSRQYDAPGSTFVVLYGRRRLGKTALIHRFLADRPNSFYFMADKEPEAFQINKLKSIIIARTGDTFLEETVFDTWDKVFDYLITRADFTGKLVLAIDEFQNLAIVNSSFPSVFQRIWDTKLKALNIMLIISGSHVSMMYSTALAYSSPLYGRRTADIRLLPIAFRHWDGFFPQDTGRRTLMEFYAVASGVPKYIELLDRRKDIFTNIEQLILDKDGFFYTEPRFLLSQEVNDTTNYFSILRIIATGEHKLGNIAAKLGVGGQRITQYLDILRDLDIIERRVPITETFPEKSRKGLYFIKDYFVRFWFRFVFPWQSYLEMGDTGFVMQKVRAGFSEFASLVFEDVARQMLIDYTPFPLNHIGAYWSRSIEIDVVGYNDETAEYIFGECKWTNEKVGLRELHQLIARAAQVSWPHEDRSEHFILFSRSGFTDELHAMAQSQKSLVLVDFSEGGV